jgi:two-component system sensor histidine kinase GlrK
MHAITGFARSIPGLTLASVLFVALPLVGTTVSAILGVDRVAEFGSTAAERANEFIRLSGNIGDRLRAMERAASQFAVVQDARLWQGYLRQREAFLNATGELRSLTTGTDAAEIVNRLILDEAALFSSLPAARDGGRKSWNALSVELASLQARARLESEEASQRAAEAASELRRKTTWQLATIVPLTVLLAALSTLFITRPVRSVGDAIRRLASGEFGEPVAVRGPLDIQRLGESLDVLRQRMQVLEKQKSRFVRHISHELKTPLTTIRQGAELLADRRGTSLQETVEIADLLRESSIELQKLIEDLLEYGRTQQVTNVEMAVDHVDLTGLVRKIIAERAFRARSIVVDLDLEDVQTMCDARQMKTVFGNLIDNALKFTPAGGRIVIGLHRTGDGIEFDIVDSGPGIPAQDRGRVFEPFFQGHSSTPGPVKGTGLGLAIAREHVLAHGGRIDVLDSQTGAHFRVWIPGSAGG